MLDNICRAAFRETPSTTLFHYTSYAGLQGIADSKALRLSEARYLNDSQELKDFKLTLHYEIAERFDKFNTDPKKPDILDFKSPKVQMISIVRSFESWLHMKFGNDRWALCVGSFSEEGNLLSQWRGYCQFGKGVSIGFLPSALTKSASNAGLLLGRCIYEHEEKMRLASAVVDEVISVCKNDAEIAFDPYGENNAFHKWSPRF